VIDIPNAAGLVLSVSLVVLGLYFGGHAVAGLVQQKVRVAHDGSEVRGEDAISLSSLWLMYAAVLTGGGLVGIVYAAMRQWHW